MHLAWALRRGNGPEAFPGLVATRLAGPSEIFLDNVGPRYYNGSRNGRGVKGVRLDVGAAGTRGAGVDV